MLTAIPLFYTWNQKASSFLNREVDKWLSRQSHKLEIEGSNPSLATILWLNNFMAKITRKRITERKIRGGKVRKTVTVSIWKRSKKKK